MCYHNSQKASAEVLEKRFKAKAPKDLPPIYHANAFAYPLWPIISHESPQLIQQYHWGLIPHWARSESEAHKLRTGTHNAKSETAFSLPSFQQAMRQGRCLVLSSGFYEYREYKKKKYPYFISLKETEVFAMAGIFDIWTDAAGQERRTFSILTTEANPLVAGIHNVKKRMPVILPIEAEKEWLNPALPQPAIQDLMKPLEESYFQAYTVSGTLLSSNENTAEAILPFIHPSLPPLGSNDSQTSLW